MDDIADEKRPPLGALDDRDWMLQTLVEWANNGVKLPITVTVGAGFITGTLVSGKEYIEYIEKVYFPTSHGETSDTLSQVFNYWKQPYEPGYEEENNLGRFYIHLKDAKLFNNGAFVPNDGTYWRGRISSIDGFSLGELAKSKD